jgi:hypothetical protein
MNGQTDELLGVTLIDWQERDVFLIADGRQYVFDEQGQRLFGLWIHPCFFPVEEPLIVESKPNTF